MLKPALIAGLAALALASPLLATQALAEGDAAKGADDFKKCRACHEIVAPDGTAVVKGGKTGPNLYGVIGRAAGAAEGYSYSDALKALGAAGEVWTEEDIAAYITDPNEYVRGKTGDDKAKTKMTFRLKEGQADLAAYLASIGK